MRPLKEPRYVTPSDPRAGGTGIALNLRGRWPESGLTSGKEDGSRSEEASPPTPTVNQGTHGEITIAPAGNSSDTVGESKGFTGGVT